MSSLMQKRRTRGETVLALIGVVVGLGQLYGTLGRLHVQARRRIECLALDAAGPAAVALTEA